MNLGNILDSVVDAITGRGQHARTGDDVLPATQDPYDDPAEAGRGDVLPASQDPYGDPAEQAYADQHGYPPGEILPASQDPYGDPADVLPASEDPYGDPADQELARWTGVGPDEKEGNPPSCPKLTGRR